MASSSEQLNDIPSTTNPLDWYGSYPFADDNTYQQGLASIIAGGAFSENPSDSVKEEILRRTRVFYFNKMTGSSITMDEARDYEYAILAKGASGDFNTVYTTSQTSSSTNLESKQQSEEEPRILTFAELKELIETGKVDQIPNNKVIPEALNDAPPSESTAPSRKKPWEIAASGTMP